MPQSIEKSFVKQYESDVLIAYQQKGSKLLSTIRTKKNVKGLTTTFQRIGKGSATQKGRHGLVASMNIDHEPVTCTLSDWYAPDYIDELDELKINHNERQAVIDSGAYALGRKTDELIFAACANAPVFGSAGTDGLTKVKAKLAMTTLGNNEVPETDRFAFVGWAQWGELLEIEEFAKSDFVGVENLPWKTGGEAKKWLGILWAPHGGLPLNNGVRTCFAYHKQAIGHASGQEIQSRIDYVPERVAHLALNKMSMGAIMTDSTGVGRMLCKE